MMAVFTDIERAKRTAEHAKYCLRMTGKDRLQRMPPDFGIVVNPGFIAGLDISADGIRRIRKDFIQSPG